jgi:hypothetical protein
MLNNAIELLASEFQLISEIFKIFLRVHFGAKY